MVNTRDIVRTSSKLIIALTAVLCVSGCAAVWPRMKHMEKLATNATGSRGCASVESYTKQNASGAIEYMCLDEAIDELEDMEGEIGRFRRGTNYAGVAAGTYAGYLATRTTVSKVPLRNVGIALAGLVGFNQATGADSRLPVISAGLDALTCVRETAVALESTSSIPPQEMHEQLQTLRGTWSDSLSRSMQIETVRNIPLVDKSQQKLRDDAVQQMQATANTTINFHILQVEQAQQTFNAQVTASKAALASQVFMFVDKIRRTVRSQLASGQLDLKDIFSQQQQAVEQMGGSVVASGADINKAVVNGNAVTGSAAPTSDNTKALGTVFDSCVASTGSSAK